MDDYDYGYEAGMSAMKEASQRYIDQIEKEAAELREGVYKLRQEIAELKTERDQLKQQLNIATNGPSAMVEKSPARRQLRHV